MSYYEPTEAEVDCVNCHAKGICRIYKLEIPNQPAMILSSFTCDGCGAHTRDHIDEYDESPRGRSIKITAELDNIEDLKRFVYLPGHSDVVFWRENEKLEYSCANTNVWVLEAVLEEAIKDLSACFKINLSTDTLRSNGSTYSNVDSREAAQKAIALMSEIRKDGKCRLEITDMTGNARVYPKNSTCANLNTKHIDLFDDGQVKHVFETVEE